MMIALPRLATRTATLTILVAAALAFHVPASGVLFAATNETPLRENWMTRVYRAAGPSVVDIRGDKVEASTGGVTDAGSGGSGMGMGTGIVIDPRGYIVTNFHVVDGIRTIQVTTSELKKYTASLITRDPETDLAIIKIETKTPLAAITFGRSNDVAPGEEVIAIGNPFGYAATMTNGIVSGVGREVEVNDTLLYRGVIQTNAAINPGNSGGPLVNVEGEMIGINAAIRQGAQCIAFAIPVDQVLDVSAKMVAQIVGESVSLGVHVRREDRNGESRVVVSSIESDATDTTSSIGSLNVGDIVVAVGDEPVRHPLDFYRAFLSNHGGDEVFITVQRDTIQESCVLALASPRIADRRRAAPPTTAGSSSMLSLSSGGETATARSRVAAKFPTRETAPSDAAVWETLGIRVEPIASMEFQSKYAKFLSLYPYGGVRITAVRPKSTFAGEGIRAGDVIVGIHEWSTTSLDDLRYIASEWSRLKDQGSIRVLIIRGDDGHFYRYVPVE